MYLEDLLDYIKDYEPQYKELILKAYEFANEAHKGTLRKSGEPYIIHPVSVACILAEMKADADTIAAGLLHDTIEDVDGVTKDLIAEKFNPSIANLVDGVTKMKKYEFNNDKRITDEENQRKIIESVLQDIRILIIKLADRLHNMRTLEFQTPEKQIEKSKETMEFFVPFALLIGEYTFKQELEDLSFKYLNPKEYNEMQMIIHKAVLENRSVLDQIIYEVAQLLNHENIPFEVKLRIKNAFGLYRRLQVYPSIDYVHDLFELKFVLNDERTCYYIQDKINELYRQLPEKSKDYIARPKANLYKALHTSVYSPSGRIIQFQLRTKNMRLVNDHGLPAYWSINSLQHAAERMQNDVKSFAFYSLLEDLVKTSSSTEMFNQCVKDSILTDSIYVKTPDGETIELPKKSTPIDFAYRIHSDLGNYIVGASVNGEDVPLDFELRNGDTIKISADKNIEGPREGLEKMAHTGHAKMMIKRFNNRART